MAEEEKVETTADSKVEYANFDDMMGSELPDEVDLTPAKSEQAIDYFEEPQEEPAEAEPQPETSPEPPKEEEKPDSYWQSQHDLQRNQFEQERQTLTQEIENLKTQLPQVKEEELVAPQRPQEAFLDNPEGWAKFYDEKEVYNQKVLDKRFEAQDNYFQQIEQERQTRLQAEQANQLKAYQLGKLQTAGGLTPEEATKALTLYAEASTDEDAYFKKLSDFYKFTSGQSTMPKTTKPTETPAPLATQPGEAQTQKVDEADEFFGDMNNFIKNNY